MVFVESNDECNIRKMGCSSDRLVSVGSVSCCVNLCDRRVSRSERPFCRRLLKAMGLETGMDLSTTLFDAESTPPLEQCIPYHMPEVAQGLLESGLKSTSYCCSLHSSRPPEKPHRSQNQLTPTRSETASIGSLEGTGWPTAVNSWPPEYKSLLNKAWIQSSLKTYHAAWLRWKKWAIENACSINEPNPEKVAEYLCFLHHREHLAAATILVHKSVFCTFANPLRSQLISSHPLVRNVLKSISLTRFKARKPIWSLDNTLDWFKRINIAEDNLYEVSRHTALLLLLHSGRRIHDLTLLDISPGNHEIGNNSAMFQPNFGSKTDSAKHNQSNWLLKANDVKNLNSVYWIKKLIELSAPRRSARQNLNSLFITTRGRVQEASRSIIANWVKTCFKEIGIDAPPGSIRAAVASDNFDVRGLNIEEVLARGNWKSRETFFRHYYKEISKPEVTVIQRPSCYFDVA